MLDQKVQTQEEADLWNEANNPPEKTYDLFGKIEIKIFKGAYESGTRGAVPFNPGVHQKAHLIIKLYVQPLAEIDVKYPRMLEYESPVWAEWGKTTLPSIKALGINDAHEIDNQWARITRVPTGKTYEKKDTQGNPTGEKSEETTWKFVAFYNDEDECRAAYLAAGGQPSNGHVSTIGPDMPAEDAEKVTAYSFLKVIVTNAARGKANTEEAKAAVDIALAQYPPVAKFYTVDSPEVLDLIGQVVLPF